MTLYVLVVMLAAIVVLIPAIMRIGAFRSFFPSVISGLLGLGAVYLSSFWGTTLLAVNVFTICVSAFFGIPGVVSLLMLRLIAVA